MNGTIAYIGIGANLGDAATSVRNAIAHLGALQDTTLTGQSDFFITAPIDAEGNDFVNSVARIETSLMPETLMTELLRIEQEAGRERPHRNAPRTLDLDLLLYGEKRIHTEGLTIPHPRMTERAFVLIPLLQIDPFVVIPGKGPAHAFVPHVSGQAIRKLAN